MRQNSSSEEPKLGFLAPGPVFPDGKSININMKYLNFDIKYLNFKYFFYKISRPSAPRAVDKIDKVIIKN